MAEPSTPNRYQLPWISMVGAMLVVLAVVAVGRIGRAADHDDRSIAVQTVDYTGWLKAAKQDDRLQALAPRTLPAGWKSTSASYSSGMVPRWHLGVLTADQQYVGIDESLQTMSQLLGQVASDGVKKGGTVQIGGAAWATYTDSRGDYLLGRELKAPKGTFPEHILVGGSATHIEIEKYAGSLH